MRLGHSHRDRPQVLEELLAAAAPAASLVVGYEAGLVASASCGAGDAPVKENLVPANFGEWGTQGSRGGDRYAMDMLSLMDSEALSWQFYFIHHLYDIQCCFDDNPS